MPCILCVSCLALSCHVPRVPSPSSHRNYAHPYHVPHPAGPKPGQPRNLTVTEYPNGFLITWQAPLERAHLIQYYTIKYRTDAAWKTLNRGQIRPEDSSYLVKNLVGGRTYYFRVLANSLKSYESSDEVKFPVPARVKHKAITAGVVGGILFFIVAIILSICAVKICNKRKRRKQEKGEPTRVPVVPGNEMRPHSQSGYLVLPIGSDWIGRQGGK